MECRARFYQQFDADYTRPVPGEGFGGWQSERVRLEPGSTAFVSMHAWDVGTYDDLPGVWRSVEYLNRSYTIGEQVLAPLFAAVRAAGWPLIHVVAGGRYYHDWLGYRRAVELAGPEPAGPGRLPATPGTAALRQFRADRAWRGAHNQADAARLADELDFLPTARPVGDEWIAENGHQLTAICRHLGVDHLIYTGFCLDTCLLSSPGGMTDMQRAGALCSVVADATVAIESRESVATEQHLQVALWRVGSQIGLVFDSADLIAALGG